MSRLRPRLLILRFATVCAGLLLACSGSYPVSLAAAESYDPNHPVVLEMVKRGVDYLSKTDVNTYREGGHLLAAVAIYKADPEATKDHPKIKRGIDNALEIAHRMAANAYQWDHESMYAVPIAGMLLVTVDPAAYANEIRTIRDTLLACQRPNGGFGYMVESIYKAAGQSDISQTQYVMLCFWTMHQADFDIPPESIRNCMLFLTQAQTNEGGWPYQFPPTGGANSGTAPSSSLTAAGFSGYLIAGDTLGLFRSKFAESQDEEGIVPSVFKRVELNEKKKKTVEMDRNLISAVIKKGENWFTTHPYNRTTWHYYFVYSKERYESFLEITRGKKEKSPEWYNEGVEMLIKAQSPSGGWGLDRDQTDGLGPDICTSFAVLFLIRSTQKAIGEVHDDVLLGGQGLPDDPTAVVVKNGKLMNRTAATSIDDALKLLEDGSKAEGKDGLVPDQITLPKDPKERKAQLNRFARLMNSRDAATRRIAAKLLGRGDDLDYVPALIYGLSDPDNTVARYSESALRLISRQLDTFHLPREGNVDAGHRNSAILKWRSWYLSVRPDYVFVE